MEIISMDIKVFNALVERVESIEETVAGLQRGQDDLKLKPWLDNQEVCEILGITTRTLQSYRENKLIRYSRVRHKVLYKQEEVERLLASSHHPKTSTP